MHTEYMKEIIKSNNQEAMQMLAHVFDKAMEHIEDCDREMYDKLEMKLYVALHGKKLNEEMAEKIIMNMQPYHMKWSLEETTKVMKEKGYSLNPIDFWVVMNMACNDFAALFGDDLDKYAEYAKLFIDDKDAKEGKVFTYFTQIPE